MRSSSGSRWIKLAGSLALASCARAAAVHQAWPVRWLIDRSLAAQPLAAKLLLNRQRRNGSGRFQITFFPSPDIQKLERAQLKRGSSCYFNWRRRRNRASFHGMPSVDCCAASHQGHLESYLGGVGQTVLATSKKCLNPPECWYPHCTCEMGANASIRTWALRRKHYLHLKRCCSLIRRRWMNSFVLAGALWLVVCAVKCLLIGRLCLFEVWQQPGV